MNLRAALALTSLLVACNSAPPSTAGTATAPSDDSALAAARPESAERPEPPVEPEPEQPEPEVDEPDAPSEPTPRLTVVDIKPDAGGLKEQLLVQASKAKKAGKTPYVELWAGWCAPCKKVDALLEGPDLQAKLASVVLIRVDTDKFNRPLTRLGFKSPTIPAFYEVDARGKPTKRLLHGHAWKNSATIADKLPAFLLGG